jgi:hypothetical protein
MPLAKEHNQGEIRELLFADRPLASIVKRPGSKFSHCIAD